MLSLAWLSAALLFGLGPSSYASAQNDNSSATAAVDFSEAVAQEASVSAQLQLANTSNPIPLPAENPGDIPNYDSLLALAGAWPPLPVAVGAVDVGQVVANITPPSQTENTDAETSTSTSSNNNSKRQGGALRVLVVGDSMTHGSEGDYTWRYRMHEWFTSQGIAYQFVGPYAGTIKPPEPAPPEKPLLYNAVAPNPPPNVGGGYAAGTGGTPLPHFAVSGRAAATDQNLIQNVVASYPADLMLIDLGFNDLGWFYSDDNGLVNSMRNLINNARRANPNMKFVVATVVHRTFIGGRPDLVIMTDHYNSMLKQAVGGWSTPSSPVVWAPVREEYNCGPQYSEQCPASYDGLHPNELGEYQIARGFTRGLVSGLGIGKAPLEVPGDIPARPLPVPSNFQIATSDLGATATWDKVYGAYEYDVEYNINGGAPFNFSPGSVKSNRWDTRWAGDGWTYQVRVRASAGNRKGDWTGWVTATAHPKTATAGTDMNVKTHATADGIDITWDPATGPYSDSISQYNVYYWDKDEPCAFLLVGGFLPGGRASLTGLTPGHRYLIAIEAWNSVGAGFPFVARQAVPGRGAPGQVTGLKVYETDPTTSHITWDAVPGAGGYYLWNRNVNNASSELTALALGGEAAEPCWDVAFLFPGTWNYEWAVTAFNGDQDSPRSAVTAPPAEGSAGGGTCPAPPAWCPPGAFPGSPATAPVDNDNPPPAGGGGGGGGGQGPGAPTCDTATDCTPCSGNGCNGCKDESQCAGCSGPGCAGQSFPCQGTSCSVCSGSGCAGCHGSNCETCTGSACGNTRTPCSGPLCNFCVGSGCDGCLAEDCEVCTGADCGVPDDRGCQGPNCAICIGSGCSNGECVGSDCPKAGGCQGSGCGSDGTCQGSGCCRGPGCGSDGKCVGPFCISGGCSGIGCTNGRCTSLDCCSGPGCSNGKCVGPHCYQGACSGPDCGGGGTVCTGPFCCFGIDCLQGTCIGPSCVGGGEENETDDCGEPTTASVCTETVTTFVPWEATTTTTTTRTHCDEITACDARGATRTTTPPACQCTACAAEPDSNYELDFGDDGIRVHYPYPSDVTVVGPDGSTVWPTGGSGGSPPPSTTAPPPTTTTQPPSQPTSPPAPKNRLWIFQEMTPTESFLYYSWWFVYRPLDGSSWSVCEEPNDFLCQDAGQDLGCDKSDDPDADGDPGFPDGEYTMTRNEAKGCTYKGTKAGPGTLTCPGFSGPVQCGDAGRFGNEDIPCPGASFNDAVYCDY